jgi:hypothetical protein
VLSITFGDLLNVDHAWVITDWIAGPLAVGWNLIYEQPVGILLSRSWSVNTVSEGLQTGPVLIEFRAARPVVLQAKRWRS